MVLKMHTDGNELELLQGAGRFKDRSPQGSDSACVLFPCKRACCLFSSPGFAGPGLPLDT